MPKTRIKDLREELSAALELQDLTTALAITGTLEQLDERERARWAQRLGDIYRRLGNLEEAERAYERAAEAYAEAGFERHASAMMQTARSTRPPPGRSSLPGVVEHD